MANIADGNVSIKVTGKELIERFAAELEQTDAFDYDWKEIDCELLKDGSVSYEIQFCGRWDCAAAWDFLEEFCDESTKGTFEFDGTELEEGNRIYNRVYRNEETNWEVIREDISDEREWEDDEEDEDDEDDN